MQWSRPTSVIALLLSLLMSSAAWAHRGHGHAHQRAHVGVVIGVPLAGTWHYRSPDYYTYPPVINVPAPPPVYIEQNAGPAQPDYWWYYCENTQGYYPYIKECPQGWQLVAPRPPDLR